MPRTIVLMQASGALRQEWRFQEAPCTQFLGPSPKRGTQPAPSGSPSSPLTTPLTLRTTFGRRRSSSSAQAVVPRASTRHLGMPLASIGRAEATRLEAVAGTGRVDSGHGATRPTAMTSLLSTTHPA